MINKIIEECPKAWEELCFAKGYYEKDAPQIDGVHILIQGLEGGLYTCNFRNFYDYFDKLGMFVTIDTFTHDARKLECRKFQGWILFDDEDNAPCRNTRIEIEFNSRVEAEWNTFYEAFKVREGQLK